MIDLYAVSNGIKNEIQINKFFNKMKKILIITTTAITLSLTGFVSCAIDDNDENNEIISLEAKEVDEWLKKIRSDAVKG
jgi:hypothetical protein